MRQALTFVLFLLIAHVASAKEYHVAVNGNDTNDGSSLRPFKTISAAARAADPGDTITVHAGIYRERVNPPRGGESDAKRILYRAAPGEKVEITGSEVVKNWVKVQDDLWKLTLPNAFFGQFNPYSDEIHGDWFDPMGRKHHTGAVYLNGEWLTEAATPAEVMSSPGATPLWYAKVDDKATSIWAQFKGVNPDDQTVEINVRQTVFYPEKTGINYITVRGFILRDAATPWAPPTAEQIGLIGPHWSRGWIIENNVISHSICSGISLGKYGDQFDNTSANTAEGYVKTIDRALANGWNKETVGHHIVRNNTIFDCEQAGIVGSLGAIFSDIVNNDIYDIWTKRLFGGAEMAGIKLHGAVDVLIKHNRIRNAGRGLWLDWMAQGTRVSDNLFYNNSTDDILMEVDHGPYLIDNNLLMSACSIRDVSEGGAFVHNLVAGEVDDTPDTTRLTPYLQAHSTLIAGMSRTQGGDDRYYNNLFIAPNNPLKNTEHPPRFAGYGLWVYDTRDNPLRTGGNAYFNGARPHNREYGTPVVSDNDPHLELLDDGESVFVQMTLGDAIQGYATAIVNTERLGKAKVSGLGYENPDGSPLKIDRDFFGNARNPDNPSVGPFSTAGPGTTRFRVW
ncbi:MAG TPA: right-handed parallel beta-helix repeat-containing protein [Bacteroidota bacterium]|nr:right-handed parallel beta-helix repeat-containing protein [Bacteroidota bacterium]